MSRRIETKSLHWDVAAAFTVIVAAMLFLPFLRKILVWPAALLVVAFAILIGIAALRRKADTDDTVPYNFTPPSAARVPTGATEIHRRSLADKINNLDWLPFEQLVSGLYTTMGYTVKRAGDPDSNGGVDLILTKDKVKTFVQCRHWRPIEVDEKELKLFLNALTKQRIEAGIFVTARQITDGGRRFAAMNDVLVVGTKDLVRMLEDSVWESKPEITNPLDQKRKFCPRCQTVMELRFNQIGANPGEQIWCCTNFPKCNYSVSS